MFSMYNTSMLTIHRNMMFYQAQSAKAIERLSSGKRINRAADDPAGFCISQRMEAQIRGLNQASRNAQDAISLVQTGEGALNESHSILQRMRELSVQAASGSYNDDDRKKIQMEIDELTNALSDISQNTQFNTKNLLDGSGDFNFQVGANAGQSVNFKINAMDPISLGVATKNPDGTLKALDLTTQQGASDAIKIYDDAISKVSSERGRMGAFQNRLEHTINNLDNMSENLTAAQSRILDADMAKEMMNFTKSNMLMQANQFLMAQLNQQAQNMIRLLYMH